MNAHLGTKYALRESSHVLCGLMVAALCCAGAIAQPVFAGKDKDPSIEILLKRINDLEAAQKQMQEKIDKLTAASPASPPANPQPSAEFAEAAQAVASAGSAPVSSDGDHTLGPVQFRGFSDFNFGRAWFEKQPPGGLNGSPRSFTIGDFDLFTNTRISDHWSVLGEFLVTSDFSNEFGAELDRLLLTYRQNDYFKISFGKFNTSLGYYNNAFHRAQYFQTGVGRPIMYSDEDNGGILPTHSVGVTATGKIPSGTLGLHWVAEVANGRSASNPDVPIQNFVDENNGKSVNLVVYVRPDWAHGMQAGFSTYRDTMHPAEGNAIHQTILTAHVAYVGSRLEWLNEASLIRHTVQENNEVFHSVTSYSQVAWAFGRTRPFVRFDYQNVSMHDPILGSLGRQSGPSFGVNRHISNYVILKLQYGRLSRRDDRPANGFTGQLAFAF